MTRDQHPHVKLYQAQAMTLFPWTAYEPLTHALQSGEVWWEGETIYGNTMLVRLASVTDVQLVTPEGLAAAIADEREAEAQADATRWND